MCPAVAKEGPGGLQGCSLPKPALPALPLHAWAPLALPGTDSRGWSLEKSVAGGGAQRPQVRTLEQRIRRQAPISWAEPGDSGFLGTRQARTLDPVSWSHNAQEADGAGSQGPLMPVPCGSPCQASEGQLKRPDSVLEHSRALFLSQGGMCDSPAREWRPLVRWRSKQSFHCAREGSPRGSGSNRPLVAGPCTSL